MYNICRVCFTNDNLTSIFLKEDNILISEKVMSIAAVSISQNDRLPDTICTMCLQRLHDSYKFKLDCEKSDIQLRAKLIQENLKPEMEKEVYRKNKSLKSLQSYCKERKHEYKTCKMIEKTVSLHRDAFQNDEDNNDYYSKHENRPDIVDKTKKKISQNLMLIKNVSNAQEETKEMCVNPQKQQCVTCGKVLSSRCKTRSEIVSLNSRSSRYRLKMHMRTHTGERPYCCEHCKKTFSLASTLRVHMRVHTGEKPLSCSTCGKSFAHTTGLQVHARLHTGETPYCCTLCPRSFRTPSHLHYHIRQHTGEKEFTCETCKKSFITENALKRHSLTHTTHKPHVCHVCGGRFLRLYYLKRHMAIHNRTRSYTCDQCQSSFSKESDLQEHETEHSPCQNVIHATSNSIKRMKDKTRSKSLCQEEGNKTEIFLNKGENENKTNKQVCIKH